MLIILFRPPINARLGEATLDSNISSSPCRKVESRSPVHSGVKTTLTLTAATAETLGEAAGGRSTGTAGLTEINDHHWITESLRRFDDLSPVTKRQVL